MNLKKIYTFLIMLSTLSMNMFVGETAVESTVQTYKTHQDLKKDKKNNFYVKLVSISAAVVMPILLGVAVAYNQGKLGGGKQSKRGGVFTEEKGNLEENNVQNVQEEKQLSTGTEGSTKILELDKSVKTDNSTNISQPVIEVIQAEEPEESKNKTGIDPLLIVEPSSGKGPRDGKSSLNNEEIKTKNVELKPNNKVNNQNIKLNSNNKVNNQNVKLNSNSEEIKDAKEDQSSKVEKFNHNEFEPWEHFEVEKKLQEYYGKRLKSAHISTYSKKNEENNLVYKIPCSGVKCAKKGKYKNGIPVGYGRGVALYHYYGKDKDYRKALFLCKRCFSGKKEHKCERCGEYEVEVSAGNIKGDSNRYCFPCRGYIELEKLYKKIIEDSFSNKESPEFPNFDVVKGEDWAAKAIKIDPEKMNTIQQDMTLFENRYVHWTDAQKWPLQELIKVVSSLEFYNKEKILGLLNEKASNITICPVNDYSWWGHKFESGGPPAISGENVLCFIKPSSNEAYMLLLKGKNLPIPL